MAMVRPVSRFCRSHADGTVAMAAMMVIDLLNLKVGHSHGLVKPWASMASVIVSSSSLLITGPLLAQQPVQPLPKLGFCPIGYQSSGAYCVPNAYGNTRGAIENLETAALSGSAVLAATA